MAAMIPAAVFLKLFMISIISYSYTLHQNLSYGIIVIMNNNNIIRTESANKAGSTGMLLGAYKAGSTGMFLGAATAVVGGIMIPLGAGAFGIGVLSFGVIDIALGYAGKRKARIAIPENTPAFNMSDGNKELIRLLDEYIGRIDNKANDAAREYIRTASKMKTVISLPEYETDATDDDKQTIRVLIKGTSMNESTMSMLPDKINKSSRMSSLGGDAGAISQDNLNKITKMMDDVNDALDRMQKRMVSHTSLDINAEQAYLDQKLATDSMESIVNHM